MLLLPLFFMILVCLCSPGREFCKHAAGGGAGTGAANIVPMFGAVDPITEDPWTT